MQVYGLNPFYPQVFKGNEFLPYVSEYERLLRNNLRHQTEQPKFKVIVRQNKKNKVENSQFQLFVLFLFIS